MNDDRQKQDWLFTKAFQTGNAIVKVNSLEIKPRKRFSIEIGRANDDGKLIRHYGIFIDVINGKCHLRESVADKIAQVIREAEQWALDMSQVQEDEIIAARIEKEQNDANRGKPPTRHTGKTERDRAKRKGGSCEDVETEPVQDSKKKTDVDSETNA
jgi:hypothetical protein